jgi:hypothetical protein
MAGQEGLKEAENILNSLNNPDIAMMMAVLGAFRIHKDLDRAERISKRMFEIDPNNPKPYVLYANILKQFGLNDKAN